MRKDLRLGLGIGALALLFAVTFLVVRNHTQNQAQQEPETAQVVAIDGATVPLANIPAGTPGAGGAPNLPTDILPPLQMVTGEPRGKTVPPDDNPFARQPSHTPEPPMPTGAQARRADANWDALISEGRRQGASSAALSRVSDPTLSTPDISTAEHAVPSPARANRPDGQLSSSTGRPYTIRQGDTFSSVAKANYGAEKYYLQIEQANPNVNTLRLRPGQQIVLPELAADSRSGRSGRALVDQEDYSRPINPRYEYRVDTGDSLSRISMKLYGTARMMDSLYEANRAAIGSDPDQLRLGMILRVPPEPGSGK